MFIPFKGAISNFIQQFLLICLVRYDRQTKHEFLAIFCRIVTTRTNRCQTVSVLPWRHTMLCPDLSSLETFSIVETKSKQKYLKCQKPYHCHIELLQVICFSF